jgi:hypothetical protein
MSNNENFLLNESSTGGTGDENKNKSIIGGSSALTLPPLPLAKNSTKANVILP